MTEDETRYRLARQLLKLSEGELQWVLAEANDYLANEHANETADLMEALANGLDQLHDDDEREESWGGTKS